MTAVSTLLWFRSHYAKHHQLLTTHRITDWQHHLCVLVQKPFLLLYFNIYFFSLYISFTALATVKDSNCSASEDLNRERLVRACHFFDVNLNVQKCGALHVCFSKCVIHCDYPPLQPFPLQEAREVHGLLVGGKWSSTQIITNYSGARERHRRGSGDHFNNISNITITSYMSE